MMLRGEVISPDHFDILFAIFGLVFKKIWILEVYIQICLFILFLRKSSGTFFTAGLATHGH